MGEHLYAQAGSGLCKLDKQTGKSEWRILEVKGEYGSYQCPPATIRGVRQMVVQTRTDLAGIDLVGQFLKKPSKLPGHEHPHARNCRRLGFHEFLRRKKPAFRSGKENDGFAVAQNGKTYRKPICRARF